MKAQICIKLARPTFSGSFFVWRFINGTKQDIESKVQDFISERCADTSLIPPVNFHVELMDGTGRSIKEWNYAPTIR